MRSTPMYAQDLEYSTSKTNSKLNAEGVKIRKFASRHPAQRFCVLYTFTRKFMLYTFIIIYQKNKLQKK